MRENKRDAVRLQDLSRSVLSNATDLSSLSFPPFRFRLFTMSTTYAEKPEKELETGSTERQDASTAGEEEIDEDGDSPKAPDGGLQAWLCAAGAFCVFFAGLGFVNSNGIFIEYYLSHQLNHRTADDVAWIGSLSNFIQFGSGVIGGPMFDRYGAWVRIPSPRLQYVSL